MGLRFETQRQEIDQRYKANGYTSTSMLSILSLLNDSNCEICEVIITEVKQKKIVVKESILEHLYNFNIYYKNICSKFSKSKRYDMDYFFYVKESDYEKLLKIANLLAKQINYKPGYYMQSTMISSSYSHMFISEMAIVPETRVTFVELLSLPESVFNQQFTVMQLELL